MSEELQKKLFDKKENGWLSVSEEEKQNIFDFSKGYMNFLNQAKTEREFVKMARKLADESITFGIKALVKDNNSIFGVDAMHGYVHSNKLAPIATDIQTTWDNIQDFIVILWNDIETK